MLVRSHHFFQLSEYGNDMYSFVTWLGFGKTNQIVDDSELCSIEGSMELARNEETLYCHVADVISENHFFYVYP